MVEEGLLVVNGLIMLGVIATFGIYPWIRKEPRLDQAVESMARLESMIASTGKMLDYISHLQQRDQQRRHDLRNYVQGLEVRLTRVEERLPARIP